MKKFKDIVVATGTYINTTGEEKKRWKIRRIRNYQI
jgi:hypothetical protein